MAGSRPLTEQERSLAARYWPMAKRWATARGNRFPRRRDEFESQAHIALMDAARLYRPEMDVKFSTYLLRKLNFAGRDVLRATSHPQHRLLSDAESLCDGVPLDPRMLCCQSLDDPGLRQVDNDDEFDWLLRLFPRREQEVASLVYRHGMTQAEAAEKVGFSDSYVSAMLKTAYQGVRRRLEGRAIRQSPTELSLNLSG